MKRLVLCLMTALLLLALTGCGGGAEAPEPMLQPVSFYYRTAATDFSSGQGIIRAEQRDLGSGSYSDQELFALYFEGPKSRDLTLPTTQNTKLLGVSRSGGILEIRLSRDANSPVEFDHALTYACLAKTGLALEGIRKVRIRVSSPGGTLEDDVLLSDSDILLTDNSGAPAQTELTLYYGDEEGRFLLTEKRSLPAMSAASLPQYALELLSKPQSPGMRSVLPPGAAVLDVTVENGLCSVDFNGDFLSNRPDTEQGEQLAILSVVNTLCEQDNINQVRIYVEGRRLAPYVWLDLSNPWQLDSAVVGPVREELNEFAAQLCLPGQLDNLLHRLTVRCRARGGASREEALLTALYSRSAQNGLSNPLSGLPASFTVSTERGLCRVELALNSLPLEEGPRQLALRCIVASLCSLPDVEGVMISENGTPLSPEPWSPDPVWFCAGS